MVDFDTRDVSDVGFSPSANADNNSTFRYVRIRRRIFNKTMHKLRIYTVYINIQEYWSIVIYAHI